MKSETGKRTHSLESGCIFSIIRTQSFFLFTRENHHSHVSAQTLFWFCFVAASTTTMFTNVDFDLMPTKSTSVNGTRRQGESNKVTCAKADRMKKEGEGKQGNGQRGKLNKPVLGKTGKQQLV